MQRLNYKVLFIVLISIIIIGIVSTVYVFNRNSSDPRSNAFNSSIENTSSTNSTLQIQLKYNKDLSSLISIGEITKLNRIPPENLSIGNGYKLNVKDVNNNVIHTLNFDIPNKLIGEEHYEDIIPEKETNIDGNEILLDQTDFALTIPWFSNANSIELLNPENQLITSNELKSIQEQGISPNFRSITASELLKTTDVNEFNRGNLSALENSSSHLDITFISSNFNGDYGTYHQKVEHASSRLLRYEPFKSRAGQIRFHYIDTNADLGCHSTNGIANCNYSNVISEVIKSGVPYDNIVVMINKEYDRASAYFNGPIMYMPTKGSEYSVEVFAHEMGHIMGLHDEYVPNRDDTSYKGTSANCFAGTPPSPEWTSIPGVKYAKGCNYPNEYRSSNDSIMRNTDSDQQFNEVSKRIINKTIDIFSTPPPTPTPTAYGDCYYKKYGDADCDGKITVSDARIFRNEFIAFSKGQLDVKKAKANFDRTGESPNDPSTIRIDIKDARAFASGFKLFNSGGGCDGVQCG